jgi:hypothetical protein
MTALSIACMTKVESAARSSAISIPMKAWKKPIMTTISSAKKMSDSRIMTFNTTNIAPKKRNVSRYSNNRIQNMGAVKARKSYESSLKRPRLCSCNGWPSATMRNTNETVRSAYRVLLNMFQKDM